MARALQVLVGFMESMGLCGVPFGVGDCLQGLAVGALGLRGWVKMRP